MTEKLTTIGFDADDTLWQNEQFFRLSQERFAQLLGDFAEPDHLEDRLFACETRNLGRYGFGIKGFVLSMIETAIEVTEGRVPAHVIQELISVGQDMLVHPIELLDQAQETIEALTGRYKIILITKGDLLDQERKLAQSGLGDLFDGVEILSHKTTAAYHEIFERHGAGSDRAMMVGNSLRSDVIPVLDAGGWGVFVPHDMTGRLEWDDEPQTHARYHRIAGLGELEHLIRAI